MAVLGQDPESPAVDVEHHRVLLPRHGQSPVRIELENAKLLAEARVARMQFALLAIGTGDVEALATFVRREEKHMHAKRLMPYFHERDFLLLQFAVDPLLFVEDRRVVLNVRIDLLDLLFGQTQRRHQGMQVTGIGVEKRGLPGDCPDLRRH